MKNIIILLSFVIGLSSFNFISAQSEQFYNKISFSDIIEDEDYFWIASSKSGLIKWNKSGSETTFFNKTNSGLLSSKLLCLYKDNQNNIWIGTEDLGIIKFDGTTWINYNVSNSDIPVNHVTAITGDDNGSIYIGTYQGGAAKLYGGNSWEVYNTSTSGIAENNIQSIVIGNDGKVYFGWTNLSILDGTSWQTFDYNDMGSSDYWGMTKDNEGNIWMASYFYGIAKYDGSEFTVYNTSNSNLPTNNYRDIYVDENNHIWLASAGEGLIKFDGTETESFIPTFDGYEITHWEKLCPNNPTSMFLIAYRQFAEFNGTDFTKYALDNEPQEITHVNQINIVGEKKYIGTNNSFLVRDNDGWVEDLYDFSFTNGSTLGKNDTLFTASRNGLRKHTETGYVSYTPYNSDVKDDYIDCIATDTNGTIWFSPKNNGLQAYKNGTILSNVYDGNLCSLTILDLFGDSKGYIWAGSYSQGLSYYKDSVWNTKFINPEDESSFQGIVDFAENAAGEVYISTNSGLAKFVNDEYQIVNNYITGQITFDADDNLWVYSGFEDDDAFIVKYTDADSIVYDPATTRVSFDYVSDIKFDDEGYLWIGYSEAGIMKFDINNPNHTEIENPPTGIENIDRYKASEINIYPNPTSGRFEISSKSAEINNVVVYDISGKKILDKKSQNKKVSLDLGAFSKGIYILSYTIDGVKYSEKISLK